MFMKTHSAKFLGAIPMALGLFALTASTAFGVTEEQALTEAVNSNFNEAATAATPPTTSCPTTNQQALPEAPTPKNQNTASACPSTPGHLGTTAKVLSKINFLTSAGLAEDPTSPGPLTLKGGSFGVTYGDCQISQMLAKSGIPNTEDTKVLFNVTVTSAPLTAAIATTAGNSAIQQIQQQEAGLAWEQNDINSVNGRVNYLKKTAYTQKITVSAAILTKDGKLYTCEVGKEPEVFLRPNDPNGSTNPIELATGGSSDALRVGSSYSTSVFGCTAAKSLGKESKLQVGLEAYKNTRPYKNENVTFGNEIFANQKSFDADKLGAPNAVRADFVYNQKINDFFKFNVSGTAGAASDKPIYSLNTTISTGRNNLFADTSQGYYVGMVSNDPTDQSAAGNPQKQTGKLIGDSYRFFRNYSVFGDAEWNKGVPNAAQATTTNGVTNFNVKKVGAQYEKKMKWGSNGQARLIAGGDIQLTDSPDGSLTAKDRTYNGYLKISASGKLVPTAEKLGTDLSKLVHKKKKKDDGTADTDATPESTTGNGETAVQTAPQQ
jgi:hypothetical protein